MASETPSWLPVAIMIGFCVVFPLFWMLILRLLAMFGWDGLAHRYAANGDVPPDAMKYGSQSGALGTVIFASVSYSNCLNVWLDRNYLYLRPTIMYRLFHPLLKIPFAEIRDIRPRRALWLKGYKLTLHPDVKTITLFGRSGAEVSRVVGCTDMALGKA